MSQLFHALIYQPLFNLLVFFYTLIPGQDVGIAIILLTLVIKLLFYPLTKKTSLHQKRLQELAPHLKKIQEDHKGRPELLSQETMRLYREHGVSPFGGCLPLLIQLPILIGLFQVFRTGFTPDSLVNLYSFIKSPGAIDPLFLGIIDLSQKNIYLALLAGIAQFFQGYFFTPQAGGGSDTMGLMSKQMMLMAPALTFFISLGLPAALPFYWLINTLATIGETVFNERMFSK